MNTGKERKGEQVSLLHFTWESRGSKSILFEMQYHYFKAFMWYNRGQLSYVNMQYLIGKEIYLYNSENYSLLPPKRWNENDPKRYLEGPHFLG